MAMDDNGKVGQRRCSKLTVTFAPLEAPVGTDDGKL
jgi:hypothetical protein